MAGSVVHLHVKTDKYWWCSWWVLTRSRVPREVAMLWVNNWVICLSHELTGGLLNRKLPLLFTSVVGSLIGLLEIWELQWEQTDIFEAFHQTGSLSKYDLTVFERK